MEYSTSFKDKIILVIGGTGTIGSEIVSQLLDMNPKTIRILSNSENELWETKLRFKDPAFKLRFLLGDIRDYERILRAANNVDYIFNAAAVKHVPISEYNPMEAINVNIHGLENIIEAAFKCNVEKFVHISTDKAVNPTTVMGATKMLGERLCISRELAKGTHKTQISIVRFGNVLGSRGSIIPLIKEQIKSGNYVTLTDEKMKRFFLSISQAVGLVLKAAVMAKGGEIFVLKMPSIFIKDLIEILIEEYAPKIGKDPDSIKVKIIGPRMGEKINEVLI
ncbi:MAG: SDR family NAD(P)-dependent oxidoreductase, partial [Promethearchaeota archaeon]